MSSLDEIDSVYSSCAEAGHAGWSVVEVSWPELERLHGAIKLLDAELRRHDLAEEWSGFTGFFKRFRFFLTTTPLAPTELLEEMEKWRFSGKPNPLREALPSSDLVGHVSQGVVEAFEKLMKVSENPLWRAAIERIPKSESDESDESDDERIGIAIVCPNTRLKERISILVDSLEVEIDVWVLRPSELKGVWLYHQLIVFGPSSRHERDGTEFLFKSPRADSLVLFTPSFFPTRVPGIYDFSGSVRSFAAYEKAFEIPTFSNGSVERISYQQDIEVPEELEPSSDADPDKEWLESLPVLRFAEFSGGNNGDEMDDDSVVSRPVILAQDSIAFLPEDGWVYRIIECESDESEGYLCETVEHTKNTDIAVGDAILFSTEGGGEMIEEVADHLLGADCRRFRELQAIWKQALLNKVNEFGLVSVSRELTRLGAKSALRINVKNWCRPWNIAPGKFSDFEVVLSFCDLQHLEEEMITASGRLRSAHRSAGFKLSGKLIEVMKGRKLDELFSNGVQVFTGGTGLPNTKTAYLVEMIIPEPVDIPRGETMKPKPLSEKSWL